MNRVVAIFPEHFQSFTVELKIQLFYKLFRAKVSQLFLELETKINRHIPAKINQQEPTKPVIVSRLRAGGRTMRKL
jgi:hypothetical protein